MKTKMTKMQAEHAALILFCGIIFSILGAVMAVLSHYPPPAYILAAAGFGIATGGVISARRESLFIASLFQSEAVEADESAAMHILDDGALAEPVNTNCPFTSPYVQYIGSPDYVPVHRAR